MWKTAFALAIVLVVVLAGATAYYATLPRQAGGAITYTIGIEIAVSGTYATDGPLRRDGAILAVEQMNATLRAAGSPITFRYIHEDSGGTPSQATTRFTSLLAAGVEVVVGPLSSGEVNAIMPLANSNHVVSISPSSTAPHIAFDDFSFRVAPNDAFQARAMATLFSDLGYTKIAIIHRDDDYGRGLTNLTKQLYNNPPATQVESVPYTVGPAGTSYATEVGILSSRVSALGTGPQTAVVMIAFEDDGKDIVGHASVDTTLSSVRWFGSETVRRNTFLPGQSAGSIPVPQGDWLVARNLTGFFPSAARNPVVTKFTQDYTARWGRAPSAYAYYSYDAAMLAMLSILRAGKYDGDAIKAVLPEVGRTYVGASGHKIFDANGDYAAANYRLWHINKSGTTFSWQESATWFYETGLIVWD